jgi:hypothetical protein
MAEIRFNYGDKFTQTSDSNTGIGSTIPAAKLDIAGGASAGSLRVSGIATLSSYQGFVNKKLTTPTEGMIVEAGQSGSVSGEVVVGTGQTISVSTGATTGQGGIQSLKVSQTFMPPVGGTADRPTDVKPGMVYYNKDFKTIEFWDGNFWKQVDNTTRRGRAVWAGGYDQSGAPSSETRSIDFMNTHTLGNSRRFGDLTSAGQDAHGSGNAERGLFQGRFNSDAIEYITIASEGNSIDFGDMNTGRYYTASASSSTRSITMGGATPSNATNSIEYVQIMTLGNALDFGDMSASRFTDGNAFSNGVEAFVCGGYPGTNQHYEIIKISSTGNSIQGDIAPVGSTRWPGAGCANSVRGVWAGGADQPHNFTSVISFINMSSKGNAQPFGDLSKVAGGAAGAAANSTRALIPLGQHGFSPSAYNEVNIVEFITISTGGNAQDFGDLRGAENRNHTRHISPVSDSHGGLGGF